MLMPFGKFKDKPIHEVPRYYLRWALDNLNLDSDLETAMNYGLLKQEYNPAEEPETFTYDKENPISW